MIYQYPTTPADKFVIQESNRQQNINGSCDCGQLQYTVKQAPLFVHCCHCTWCQRESGAAFAINAIIESSAVEVTEGLPALINTPTASGNGQIIARCPACQVALWSHYPRFGKLMSYIKVGTLDDPNQMPPDIHIYTQSKQHWFELPAGMPAFEGYYDRDAMWPKASLVRLEALIAQQNEQQS